MTTSSKNVKSKSENSKNNSLMRTKQAWNQCQTCRIVIKKMDNEAHSENVCAHLEIPFLFKNYANLSLIEHPKDTIKLLNIKKDYLFDYAFIHPCTMKLIDLKLGDLVLLKYQSEISILAICWPSSQIDQSQLALSQSTLNIHGIQLGNDELNVYVSLCKLDKTQFCQASEMTVEVVSDEGNVFAESELINDADNSDMTNCELSLLKGLIKEMYLGKFVLDDQQMFIVYMGKKLIFQITNVAKQKNSKKKKKENSIDLISEKLTNSSLTDSKEAFSDQIQTVISTSDRFFKDSTISTQIYQITQRTQLNLRRSSSNSEAEFDQETEVYSKNESRILFKDLAGLDKEIELLKEFFFNPFEYSDLYNNIGLNTTKGILLFGPSGCGKTSLARAACNEFKYSIVELKVAEIYSRNYNETETKLRQIFQMAAKQSPSIIFIDDIDNFCSRKESMGQDMEKKVLTLFTSLLDEAKMKNVSLLCTTNKIDAIDLSLRRPGRLDKEIEISIPNQLARYKILHEKLRSMKTKLMDSELLEVSQNCHGYVGSDLELLSQEAGLCCVKRLMALKRTSDHCENDEPNSIMLADLLEALHTIKPSAMKEITFDIPKVYWSQIGGQYDLKKKLQQAIVWPIKHADSFKRLNIKPPRGLLMYGPPGCSKTMIAKALATETGLNFIAVKGPELFSKWVGESERMVREIFRKARNAAPSIIFFDEIDAVAVERSSSASKGNNVGDRVLAQLLNEMDGVENLVDVTVVAATNRPDMIDKALMRPGRLDRIVYVTLPNDETRREIFELKFKQLPVEKDINLDVLVEKTKRYSGAEIAAVCNEAAFFALDGNMDATHVGMDHFERALNMVPPRISDSTIEYFDGFSFNSG